MNILCTSTAYPPSIGGAQIHLHLLARQFSLSHQVSVVSFWDRNRTDWLLGTTLRTPGTEMQYVIDGIQVYRLGFNLAEKIEMIPLVVGYYPFMPYSSRKIAEILESKIGIHASHANVIHNVRIGREPISLASQRLARKAGIPFVLTPVHHPRWKGWRYRVYEQLYRDSDALIALTQAEKQLMISLGVKEDHIFITGTGPNLANESHPEEFREKHKISGPFVLFLGQHYSYKGFKQVLQSAPIVWKKCPELTFVFIGPDADNSADYFKNDLDRRILRLGKVSLQEKTDALAACSLLCVPSVQESFGGIYVEAWAFKKPVIGCPIPAVREVISNGKDGLLVDQNPEAIAGGILNLIEHPSIMQQMGEAGFRKLVEKYTWERLAKLTEDVYQKLI